MLGHHAPFESVYTDASNWGLGALYKNDWLVGTFEKADIMPLSETIDHHLAIPSAYCTSADINIKEMGDVMCAASRCAPVWQDMNIIFVTDITIRAVLSSGHCKNKCIMTWIRELFWLSCIYNFSIDSVFMLSACNTICDALSRWNEFQAGIE